MTRLRVVLVRPHYPGNLGAVARVMHNFGVSDLTLVDPVVSPDDPEALRWATRGAFILHQARTVSSLADALRDCQLTAATSANVEGVVRHTGCRLLRDLAPKLAADANHRSVAVIFGPEPHGLTTAEIDLCDYLMTIPTNPEYPSLNLAQAVAITLYEISRREPSSFGSEEIATHEEVERALQHLRQGLEAIHFIYGPKGEMLMHAVRHLIRRSQPSVRETKLLHGLARQLLWKARQVAEGSRGTPSLESHQDESERNPPEL